MTHRMPPRDVVGRLPIGTVWFSLAANAWLRRARPHSQLLARDEESYPYPIYIAVDHEDGSRFSGPVTFQGENP